MVPAMVWYRRRRVIRCQEVEDRKAVTEEAKDVRKCRQLNLYLLCG